jgi:hypothetical protein
MIDVLNLSLRLAVVGLVAVCMSCDKPDSRWSFGVYNASSETFSDAAVGFNGESFDTGQSPPGGYATAGLPGARPATVNLILTSKDGTKHTIPVVVPEPDKSFPYPCISFVIKSDHEVTATYLDPRR